MISEPVAELPVAEDERDFWALIEAAWSAAGPAADRARRAIVGRVPGTEPDCEAVEEALGAFLAELADRCAGLSAADLTRLDQRQQEATERAMMAQDHVGGNPDPADTDGADDQAVGEDRHGTDVPDPAVSVLSSNQLIELAYIRHEGQYTPDARRVDEDFAAAAACLPI